MTCYLLFWYQVLTWVSLSCSEAASSMRSWTLRYFCFWKLLSSLDSCWSLNAVRALRGFFRRPAAGSEAPPCTEWMTGRNDISPVRWLVSEYLNSSVLEFIIPDFWRSAGPEKSLNQFSAFRIWKFQASNWKHINMKTNKCDQNQKISIIQSPCCLDWMRLNLNCNPGKAGN